MAKRPLQRYEDSTVGLVLKGWLERTGIDPSLVVGWKINQRVGDLSQIELTMYFDDAPTPPPPVDRYPVGEQGPESIELPSVASSYYGGIGARRHTTCAETMPFPGAPRTYVCTDECPTDSKINFNAEQGE